MTDFLLLAFIFLSAGVLAVPIASRCGLGSVLGFLIAGILIGPFLSALHVNPEAIQHFAEFGVVMMLFLVGLELEPEKFWQMRTKLLGLGGGQVVLTTLAVALVALLLGQPWTVALAIGMVFALSSTAIVLQTLGEKGLMRSEGGQASFSVLLFQDIAVIPMLAFLPLLAMPELMEQAGHMSDHGAGTDDGAHGSGLSLVDGVSGPVRTLVTLLAIGFVVFLSFYLTRPIFRFISGAGLRELFVAAALMMVVGIALLMSLVGLSPALGTFIAGVVLANSEYRHELESDIDPFRGLLLGLFFMSVGAGIDFAFIQDNFLTIAGLTLGLMLLKAFVLLLLAVFFKITGSDRWLFTLGLAQAGEFGFVLLAFASSNAIIPADVRDILLVVVAISMLLTPLLFILHQHVIAPRYRFDEKLATADEINMPSPIVIAGNGRFGGVINRMLLVAGYRSVIVDYSATQLEMLRAFGFKSYFGDATRPELLEAAGIKEAKLFVIAIDNKEQITALTRYVRQNYPNVHVIARAVDRHHVYELYAAGCRDIIRETFDGSVRAGRSALEALGLEQEEAGRIAKGYVDDDRTIMIALAELYDPKIPSDQNKAYIEAVRQIRAIQDKNAENGLENIGTLREALIEEGFDIEGIIQRGRIRQEEMLSKMQHGKKEKKKG